MDCTGNAERFCVRQGVREFPGVMLIIDGKATPFEGMTGKPALTSDVPCSPPCFWCSMPPSNGASEREK